MKFWTWVDTTAVASGMSMGAGATILGDTAGVPVAITAIMSAALAVSTCLGVYVLASE